MRSRVPGRGVGRKGGVIVVFAAFLPVFVGMIALAIDVAIIAVARNQLSAAADAAALAGARKLFTDNHLVANADMTSEINAAQSSAVSIALSNKILGTPPVLSPIASNSSASDIFVGYFDLSSTTSSVTTWGSPSAYNAVQATISRSPSRGGVIPAFFSSVDGFSGTSLSVTSVAVAKNYIVGSFSSSSGTNANILPIALDQTTYNAMIAGNPDKLTTTGLPTDQYSYSATTGKVTAGQDGIYESCLYPVANGTPGNWGTVKIGVSNNSTSTLEDQIVYGITPAQLATFPGGKIQLSSATSPPSLTLDANPGISAGLKSAIDSIIGQTRFIPIYSAVNGNGNNTTYTIVKFAAVRLMADNFQGNPKYVIVQPALIIDPTATPSTAESTWSVGGLVTLRLVR